MVLARGKDRMTWTLIKNVLSMSGIERSVTHLVLNSVKEMPPSTPGMTINRYPRGFVQLVD
ncbi:MAG: hypothetical protein CM15mP6_3120 [Methanobacteriota archaeon]|nr:MAG: hypothetical protein CM15mP6_3120 [Euryarchaeota archaeon]